MIRSRRRFLIGAIFAPIALFCLLGPRARADSSAKEGPGATQVQATAAPLPATQHLPMLSVFAAASLKDVLKDLAIDWHAETGGDLEFNFGASSDLARQIEAGPHADVYFSADESWMDRLAKADLVDGGSRRSLLSNRLVVIAPTDSKLVVTAASGLIVAGVRHLALASPESVPAGKYAKAWLEKAGVWEAVKERVIPTLDVRACLATVESGNVEAGIVYRTDAMISQKIRVLYEVPESEGPAISYPVAALSSRPNIEAARRFVAWLASDHAREVFRKRGFLTPETPRVK